jgi:selenide, water dikinase
MAKHLMLVGGGHAHVHVLKRFGQKPVAGVRLVLVTRDLETPYSGMLPGLVAGVYSRAESHIDLSRLADFAGARLIQAEANGLDRAGKRLLCKRHAPVRYDVVSLDIGAGPDLSIPGAHDTGVPAKPVDVFLARWDGLLERRRSSGRPPRVAIVGGGAGGVELALAVERRLRDLESQAALTLVTRHDILPDYPARGREILRAEMERRGIDLVTGAEVAEARAGALVCRGGRSIPFSEAFWVTGAAAPAWLARTELSLDREGFVAVEPTLRSVNDPCVFAAGDVATVLAHPRPKAGVFAVRQGPPLEANLRRAMAGEKLRPFRPQSEFLTLIGTYDGEAVASRNGLAARGGWAWRLKQWIDRRWIRRYQDLT